MPTRTIAAATLALTALGPCIAAASDLRPLHRETFPLGEQTASVYYVPDGDTYQIVTTVAPALGAGGVPIRITGFLLPGQRQVLSVGQFSNGTEPQSLVLVHESHGLSVTLVTLEMLAIQ
jgi:hypothetical protein